MRYEITAQSELEIPAIVTILRQNQITKINLTHKATEISNYDAALLLRNSIPELDITLHCSMKYHTQESLKLFIDKCRNADLHKILLVSGSPKPNYDSIQALNDIELFPELEIYCAYNPYLNDDRHLSEDLRLREKLNFTIVKGIYLQIGIDTNRLAQAAYRLKTDFPNCPLFGSLLIPTPTILKRFKLNPIKDIILSAQYLTDLEFASQKTREILTIYQENQITPLIENIPFTDLSALPSLLSLI